MVSAFKLAIVAYITYLSLSAIWELRQEGIVGLAGYSAKNEVGTQRYGFIYILSFWIISLYQTNQPIFRLMKIPLLAITVVGLMLTFSRASVVGLLASILMFALIILVTQFKFTKKSMRTFFVYIISVLLLLGYTGLYEYLSIPLEYFSNRLFSSRWEDGSSNWAFSNPKSSEGYRLVLIMTILEYVASNPIFGSGFLGIWIILEDQIGSAHGQFNDILFRTGIVGLLTYLFLTYKLGLFLYKNDMGLFLGFIGILVYGLVHETFKLSQGAFILAFLLGMWAQSLRKGKNENRH
jgi:O-antigen ligase